MSQLNLFQWMALTVLGVMLLRDTLVLLVGRARRRAVLPRVCVMALAAWLIAVPSQTTRWANWLGIGRGADLLLYLYIMASLVALFLLYARCVRLERQVTAIVRWEALHAAECGEDSGALPATIRPTRERVRLVTARDQPDTIHDRLRDNLSDDNGGQPRGG